MKACLPSNQCTVPEKTKLLQDYIYNLCIYFYTYKSAFIYIIMACADGTIIGLFPCTLLAATGTMCYWLTVYCLWCVAIWILYNYRYMCVPVWCTIISLHALPYNIVRHGFCLTVLCLSDNPVSLIV